MHQHYQNKLTPKGTKIDRKLDSKQHTASADKKEYFEGTIFWY